MGYALCAELIDLLLCVVEFLGLFGMICMGWGADCVCVWNTMMVGVVWQPCEIMDVNNIVMDMLLCVFVCANVDCTVRCGDWIVVLWVWLGTMFVGWVWLS